MFNQRDKEKVLKHLITIRDERDIIYKPKDILYSIPHISASDFIDYLNSLEADHHINVQAASGCEESNNIYTIQVCPSAISYFSNKRESKKQDWKRWRMNITVAIISALVGAALARISMLLWP